MQPHPNNSRILWHILRHNEVFNILHTGVDGLDEKEALLRLSDFGPNKLPAEKRPSPALIMLHQFKSPLIYILLVSGAIAFLARDIIDGLVVYAALTLNAVIGFYQEYKVAKSMLALKKLLSLKAVVVRDGLEREITAEHIVPGDVVLLRSGQKAPADIRLFYAKELTIDESILTGESSPVIKNTIPMKAKETSFPLPNMVLMGTIVTAGRGEGVAVATGSRTQLGRLSEEVRESADTKTPLQFRIELLSTYIIIVTLLFSTIGFTLGILRGEDIFELFLAMAAMAVAVVPEGLPVILTIAFAASVNRMVKNNVIIRHLPAIETIGSSTVIGSDKTGTLTKNEMTVRKIWTGTCIYHVDGSGYSPEGGIKCNSSPISAFDYPALEWTLRAGLLTNESNLILEDNRWMAQGDPTEVALIVSALRGDLDEEKERFAFPRLDILAFESEFQYMATLHKHNDNKYLLVKGAPEKVISLSDSMLEVVDRNIESIISDTISVSSQFSNDGLRVLGMAFKKIPDDVVEITHKDVNGLTFLGLQGMMDPPRPDAIDAIQKAKQSGIRVLMITGDNSQTALNISRTMGIAGATDKAITGTELDKLDDASFQNLIKEIHIYARVSPHHKLRIVNALKALNEVITVTGDGVNDAPALRTAHVGVAMGITGSDVAKEAGDMVVLDDNFSNIYKAVIEGRVAFDNIRKATYFLLSIGFGMLLAIFITIVAEAPLILLPAQILWLNLVTSGLQDVALAFEPKEPDIENRPPRNPNEGLLNRVLVIRMAVVGVTIAMLSLTSFYYLLSTGTPLAYARTFALTTMVFSQLFNVFNARSEKTSVFRQNPFGNGFLFISVLASFSAQIIFLFVPAMRTVFRNTSLSFSDLIISFAISIMVLIVSELHKLFLRKAV